MALKTLEEFNVELAEKNKAEAKFKALLESAPDAMVIAERNGKMVLVNAQAERIFGYQREELLRKEMQLLFPRRFSDKHQEHLNNFFDNPETRSSGMELELFGKRKDGIEFPIEISLSLLESEEGTLVSSAIRDVTERKKTEHALKQAREKAERSEKTKQFFTNMSHEIRTPMNAIIGFTDVMEKTKLSIPQKQYVQAIKTSGENLLALVNDVLDYSKIEQGIINFEKAPICIRQLFDSLRVMMAGKAKAKGLELIFNSHDNLPDAVIGDKMRLTEILLNLVSNAIKFTENGSIIVDSTLIEDGDFRVILQFEVQDSGIGIADDKMQTIFEQYQQAEPITAHMYGGTGLGLSIVKNLVKLQGGTISVMSEIGKGSVFTFKLPFQKASEKEQKKCRKLKGKKKEETEFKKFVGLKVLLAEDNKMNQKLMSVVLAEMGIHADLAENGKIAVEKVENNNYDVVLMDMQMPEMDGYEATLHIRQNLKYNVPIIAMTAHALLGEKEKCLRLGMNEYLSKPFKTEKLFQIIGSVINTDASSEDAGTEEKTVQAVNEKPVIDVNYLKELSNNNIKFVIEMLEIFVEEIPAEINILEEAIEQGDYKTIKKFSHKLKSSTQSLNMGDEVEKILSTIENLAGSAKNMKTIRELLTQFQPIAALAVRQAKDELFELM